MLQLEHRCEGVQAVFLSSGLCKDPSSYSPADDHDMSWAMDWMDSRPPTLEVSLVKGNIPSYSDIRFLEIDSPQNPFLLMRITSNGYKIPIQSPRCLLMKAVSWHDMGLVIKSFFEDYRCLGKPLMDGTFRWNGNVKSNFITRKDCELMPQA